MIEIHTYPSPSLKLAFPLVPNLGAKPEMGSHFSHAGVGGYLELPSLQDLYDIPSITLANKTVNFDGWTSGRRKFGMIVYVLEEDKYYQLKPKYKDTKKIIPWSIISALPDPFRGFLLNPFGFEYYENTNGEIVWADIDSTVLDNGGSTEHMEIQKTPVV